MRSLSYHGDLRRRFSCAPTEHDFWRVVRRTAQSFGAVRGSGCVRGEEVVSDDRIRAAILRLDWSSSPGYPYCLIHSSNRTMFGVDDKGEPDPRICSVITQQVRERIAERSCDPIRLFIKPEPHTVRKLVDGRYRLISSVSVIDQLVDHCLFGDLNDRIVENFLHLPSRVGWAPFGGGWAWVPRRKVMAIDKSSWDWTVSPWILQACKEVRMMLEDGDELYQDLVSWRYQSLFDRPVFVTSGGILLRQSEPGAMKSGCVNTIVDNSIMQVILHEYVCLQMKIIPGRIWAMGDDTLQEIPERVHDYLRLLSKHCIVKQVLQKSEFCGFEFHGDLVEPVYFGKHAFNLLHHLDSVAGDLTRSYSLLYHRSTRKGFFADALRQMGYYLPDRVWLDELWDGV